MAEALVNLLNSVHSLINEPIQQPLWTYRCLHMSDEDKDKSFSELMEETVGKATPVRQKSRHQHRKPPPAKAVMRRSDERAALLESQNDIPPDEIAEETNEVMRYRRPHIPQKTLRDLGRGRIAVQAYIDLHGMTVAEAMTALREFIQYARSRRMACVRIVTGKGLGSGIQGARIRPKVLKWLQQADVVQAYCPAPHNDGGSGALYVLLK